MNIVNEEELFRKTDINKTAICQMCGENFYTNRPNRVKYCSKCRQKVKYRKPFEYNLSNKDFKKLYEKYWIIILKGASFYISQSNILFEYVVEHSLVNLYFKFLRMLEKGASINDLLNISKSSVYFIIKDALYSVLKANDLPPFLHCHNKNLIIDKHCLRLDLPTYLSNEDIDKLADFIIDKKPMIEHILDLKKLTKQIFMESTFDSSIKAAVIRAELKDINLRTGITEEEKISLINNEYKLNIQNMNELKLKAQEGIYKLYNAYAPEIKEILEITDKDFTIDTTSKELKKYNLSKPIKKCIVCGKAFISYNHQTLVCSKNCAAIRKNQNKKRNRYKNKLNELFSKAYKSNTMEECSIFLSKMEEFIKKL